MAKFKHCFIYENGDYREIPYSALFIGKDRHPDFFGRYFLPFEDCLMEVSHKDYKEEYQTIRRQKYLREESILHNELSYNALDTEDMSGEETIFDRLSLSVEDIVTDKLLAQQLHDCIAKLTPKERELLQALFFQEKTERKWSTETGAPQKTINDRRHRVLEKLEQMINPKK